MESVTNAVKSAIGFVTGSYILMTLVVLIVVYLLYKQFFGEGYMTGLTSAGQRPDDIVRIQEELLKK